jgi:hypothetical protein
MRAADTALTHNGQAVSSSAPVHQLAQEFADRILGDRDFLLIHNSKEPLLPRLDRQGVTPCTTALQGMNHLQHFHHAAYLASTNPTPFEIKSLRMFAKDNQISGADLVAAVMIERCYETAYQCIARTSIRNPSYYHEEEHIFIVPDIHYAKYLQSWFDPGCAVIDTTESYTRHQERPKTASNKAETLALVAQVLDEQRRKTGKLKDLLKKYDVSRSTVRRHKKELQSQAITDSPA